MRVGSAPSSAPVNFVISPSEPAITIDGSPDISLGVVRAFGLIGLGLDGGSGLISGISLATCGGAILVKWLNTLERQRNMDGFRRGEAIRDRQSPLGLLLADYILR